MDAEKVKKYFEKLDVVCDYARAAEKVGLWESEKSVFAQTLKPDMEILELGCGAGRIALGLYELGYKNITATDFSENMVDVARAIGEGRSAKINFAVEDACCLSFKDGLFDAAVFGFNGLMQIPGHENRRRAMSEIYRVLKKGSPFVFTTHDREAPAHSDFWEREKSAWQNGANNPELDEFGDKFYYDGAAGNIFIHSPLLSEVENDLNSVGFEVRFRSRRSEIADEPPQVLDFSDECVFWTAVKI